MKYEIAGVGSPIMDFLASVPNEFLDSIGGDKGGMVYVTPEEMSEMIARFPNPATQDAGGSSANTIAVAAKLGLSSRFVGKLGNDSTAEQYREITKSHGIDTTHLKHAEMPNARCVSLVTPDGQRTMRTNLGAALTLSPEEISTDDFEECDHVHMEGYLLFNKSLADAVINSSRAAGCSISIDMASFEVVHAAREWIFQQLGQGVDVVFANEDEIRAIYPEAKAEDEADYGKLAKKLAADSGGIAAVKMGKDGAWIAKGNELYRIAGISATLVDSTGAGDTWAGAFLYGFLRGWPLAKAGELASLLGAECVQQMGARISEERWNALQEKLQALGVRYSV